MFDCMLSHQGRVKTGQEVPLVNNSEIEGSQYNTVGPHLNA